MIPALRRRRRRQMQENLSSRLAWFWSELQDSQDYIDPVSNKRTQHI